MKIFQLLAIPDLRQPVKSTEFAYNEKYVAVGSVLIPFDKRFPIQRDMPTQAPQLTKDLSFERSYKFICEMTPGDKQFIKMAYHNAMAHDVSKKEKRQEIWNRERDRFFDQHAINVEVETQRVSIMRGWLMRFKMEKIFKHLKIESMDEWKRLVDIIHHKGDLNTEKIHQLLAKQFNQDPSQSLTPAQRERMQGLDEEILRLKVSLGRHEILAVSDMQRRLAEQAAALALTRIEQNHDFVRMQNTGTHTGQSPLLKRPNRAS